MINFFQENIDFEPIEKARLQKWLEQIVASHQLELSNLNYIFCDDKYLHSINLQYLKHDTYTDIITFDNSETKEAIEGDIYVSIERVEDNAKKFETDFDTELHRVLAHGLLHLIGFGDETQEEKLEMRKKENEMLELLKLYF